MNFMTTSALFKKLLMATAGAAFITLGAMGAAQAQVRVSEDAGQTLGTAQDISSGTGTLDAISGRISSNTDADLFRFFIDDPAAFSATTVGGTTPDAPSEGVIDTQLFLFDVNGFGVEANDDDTSGLTFESTLPAGNPFSPTSPGIYFLGISAFDNDPLSAGGEIFDDTPLAVVGPTGAGGGSPLTNFDGNGLFPTGSYEIALTGATAIPEPSSILGLLTFGVFGAAAMLKRKRGKCQN